MLFINSNVHNQILSIFHPERVSSPDTSDQTILLAGHNIHEALSIVDGMIESQSPTWMSASQPSIASYYLALLMRWLNGTESGIRSTNYLNIHSLLIALEKRPSALICAQKEGLGNTIFTSPTLL